MQNTTQVSTNRQDKITKVNFLNNSISNNIVVAPTEAINTNVMGCVSLLQVIKAQENTSIEIITKDIEKIRKVATDRTTQIIIDNIDKSLTAKTMYINQALINYSKDKNLFENIKDMDKKALANYLKDRNLSIYNYDNFSDDSDTKKFVPFPYAGGKQGGNKVYMQELARKAFGTNKYKTWVDPFTGAFGATYNVLPILLENGIEKIVINDINKSIINTYRQIQKNPKKVQRELASISIDYYKEFGKFKPETKKEARALHNKLEAEFLELELQRKMTPRRAALFMFLMTKAAGGMVDYDMKSKTCKFETSYEKVNIDLLINKVAIYHKIFNTVKMTFKSVMYQTIFKKYAKDTTALMLIDPPYMEYSEEETEKSCSYTYGIDFNHKELLNKLRNVEFDFFYYNNHNPLLQRYAQAHSLTYIKTERFYANGSKGRTKAVEITMLKLANRVKTTNSFNYVSANNIATAELAA